MVIRAIFVTIDVSGCCVMNTQEFLVVCNNKIVYIMFENVGSINVFPNELST